MIARSKSPNSCTHLLKTRRWDAKYPGSFDFAISALLVADLTEISRKAISERAVKPEEAWAFLLRHVDPSCQSVYL
jgi:hypothetical protein